MAKADYYQVLQAFSTTIDGRVEDYQQGEVVDATDPAFKKAPHLFGPLVIRGQAAPPPVVEHASAAPGEQRETGGKAITTAALKGR
jgi:hypothetical protein